MSAGKSDFRCFPWKQYFAVLISVPLLTAVAVLGVIRMPLPPGFGFNFWDSVLDYPYTLTNENADIVIFGDSSALFGIDAKGLSRTLHKKVVILPNTSASMPVVKDGPLQAYLHNNRTPELIVFYFAPWDLNAGNEPDNHNHVFEGERLLVRHGNLGALERYALRNPKDTALFPFRAIQEGVGPPGLARWALKRLQHRQGRADGLVAGHIPFGPDEGLSQNCTYTPQIISEVKTDFVAELHSRYTTKSTKTLVYLAPIPACHGADVVADRDYRMLSAAPPVVKPPYLFANDKHYSHPLSQTVPEATDELASALQEVESGGEVARVGK